jgi:peptidoglycan hydrolase FlgJ
MNVSPLQPQIDASTIAPERLAKNPKLTEKQKIAEASRQFEAILLKQILESSQKTVIKSKLTNDSTTTSIYKDMVTTQLADSISKSGTFGLSQTFEHQLDHPHGHRPDGLANSKALSAGWKSAGHLKPLHENTGADLPNANIATHRRDTLAAKIAAK